MKNQKLKILKNQLIEGEKRLRNRISQFALIILPITLILIVTVAMLITTYLPQIWDAIDEVHPVTALIVVTTMFVIAVEVIRKS